MPETSSLSRKKLVREGGPVAAIPPASYVELGVTTPFSFLRGASDSIELALAALALGMDAIGIADRNTLAGVVRMHSAAKGAGLRPLIGCRLDIVMDHPVRPERSAQRVVEGRSANALRLRSGRTGKGSAR